MSSVSRRRTYRGRSCSGVWQRLVYMDTWTRSIGPYGKKKIDIIFPSNFHLPSIADGGFALYSLLGRTRLIGPHEQCFERDGNISRCCACKLGGVVWKRSCHA